MCFVCFVNGIKLNVLVLVLATMNERNILFYTISSLVVYVVILERIEDGKLRCIINYFNHMFYYQLYIVMNAFYILAYFNDIFSLISNSLLVRNLRQAMLNLSSPHTHTLLCMNNFNVV